MRVDVAIVDLSVHSGDGGALGPTGFEQGQKRPRGVVRRTVRGVALQRLFAFAGVTIDDVINDPLAKRTVLAWYRVSNEALWEGRRSQLRERALYEQWVRLNR